MFHFYPVVLHYRELLKFIFLTSLNCSLFLNYSPSILFYLFYIDYNLSLHLSGSTNESSLCYFSSLHSFCLPSANSVAHLSLFSSIMLLVPLICLRISKSHHGFPLLVCKQAYFHCALSGERILMGALVGIHTAGC